MHGVDGGGPARQVAHQLGVRAAGVGGRGDGRAMGGEPSLQFVGEQQVGQLGLPVGRDPVVAVLPLQIVEVDVGADAVADAADRHDPGTGDRQAADPAADR